MDSLFNYIHFIKFKFQLRQKLARFNSNEFSMLLIEILNESKRRYYEFDTKGKLKNKIKTHSNGLIFNIRNKTRKCFKNYSERRRRRFSR